MTRIAKHLFIHGRVQGVGFRAFAEDAAARLGIDGWVRNRRDGRVEMVVVGPAEAVDAIITACRKGPSFAQVKSVEESEGSAEELQSGGDFASLPTI